MVEGGDDFVGHRLSGVSGILASLDVVSQAAELLDHGQREVLVGVQPGHGSGRLVRLDLVVDFVAVSAYVRPRVRQVLCP